MGNGIKFRNWITIPIVILVLLFSCMTTGCSRRSNRGGGVVARVNGAEITLARFQEYYLPQPTPVRSPEEELSTLNERLDELIGFTLIQEAGRKEKLHREEMFQRQLKRHEKILLNRIVEKKEIIDTIIIGNNEIEELLAKSLKERHFLHLLTVYSQAAQEAAEMLSSGEDWGAVAIAYSRDSDVSQHRGDLGWMAWGEGPFALYPELQEEAYKIPVGSWKGPIQQGDEFHFIKVLEERDRTRGTPQQEREAAYSRLYGVKQDGLTQEYSNRVWEEGSYHLDEDQFRWLVEQIQAEFAKHPGSNPIPLLSRDDLKRIVVRSDRKPYTASMLLGELELLTWQARDNAVTLDEWRNRFVGWVITDHIADYARRKGYDKDQAFEIGRETYINTGLYSDMLNRLEESARPPTDEDLEAYYRDHPENFNPPEMRRIVEVLVETREEAEVLLQRAREGVEMEKLAYENTIRQGFRRNFGRFAPIRREEFGPLGEAVFQTPEGEVGPVVETPLGFSIFQVVAIVPPREIKLDDVRESLRENLYSDAKRMALENFKEQAWRKARIWKNHELLRWYAEQVAASTTAADSLGTTGVNTSPVKDPD